MLSRLLKHKVHTDTADEDEDAKLLKERLKEATDHENSRAYKQAAASYEEALEVSPDDVAIRCGFGRCLILSGQNQRASEEFKTASKLHPQHIPALLGYSRCLLMAGDHSGATEQLRSAILLDPNHLMSAHVMYGNEAGGWTSSQAMTHYIGSSIMCTATS